MIISWAAKKEEDEKEMDSIWGENTLIHCGMGGSSQAIYLDGIRIGTDSPKSPNDVITAQNFNGKNPSI